MAKRRRPKDDAPATAPAAPFNSAFAGLGALREVLPAGDTPVEEAAVAPNEPNTTTAPRGKVVVTRERKGRKGKTVTRISGIGTDHDPAQWARRMKRDLGCGGSVDDNDDIVLAGDITDRAADWLEAAGVERVIRGN